MGGLKLYQTRARVAASFWHAPKPGELSKLRAQGLEIAEVRLDLAGITNAIDAAALMKHFSQMPSIATMRAAHEGGKWRGDAKTRHRILKAAMQYADAADIELSASNAAAIAKTAKAMGKTIILSRHNFNGVDTPAEMNALAKKILTPNDKTNNGENKREKESGVILRDAKVILKVAARVRSAKDLQTMEDFLLRWRRYPLVVIGMGESQHATTSRRTFPHKGSKLAFAAINQKTAPGQLPLPQTKKATRPR